MKLSYRTLLSLLVLGWSAETLSHGYTEFPKARQKICEDQGGHWSSTDGSTISNLACRAAFHESGTYPFVQTNEYAANVTRFDDQAAVEAVVTNGNLCSGGDAKKSGMSVASAHWTRTTMQSGSTFSYSFRATAPHNPSYWKVYLSNPDYNAGAKRLGWDDVTLIGEYADLPIVTKPDGRYYEFDVALPAGRVGDATLFVRWQRNDAGGEGFYNCSDIVFDGDTPPQWSSLGNYLKPGLSPAINETVQLRVFDAQGSEQVVESLQVGSGNLNDWQAQLANQINVNHPNVVRIGVEDAKGDIVFDNADIFVNQVYVPDAQWSFAVSILPATVVPPSVQISGLASEYTLSESGEAILTVDLASEQSYSARLVVIDSLNQQKEVSGSSPGQLSMVLTQVGTAEVQVWVTDEAGVEWSILSQTAAVIASGGGGGQNDYDYVYPKSIDNYVGGTRVLATDGSIYECKPFPYDGWCQIYSQGQNYYEPGVGAYWRNAWFKVN